jgi:signal recognition particle subunit SRP54
MAFENLTSRLQNAFDKLRGRGKIDETVVNEAMREVRLALLEADVNFKVVKDFIARVKERAVGQEVLKSLTPGQMVIKIVNEELIELMGGQVAQLAVANRPPTVVMMAGLQGAGKTTTTGKLAKYLQKQNRKPLLVAADIYRPAAIKQLQVLGEQLNVPVFSLGDQVSPVEIARQAIEHAKENHLDYVLIDTAGRLHIDEALMEELKQVRDDRSGRRQRGGKLQQPARADRRGTHQAGWRHARRCRVVRQGRHRQADQVCGDGRKAGRAGAVPSGPDGVAHSRDGRRAQPDRKGAGGS